METTVVARSAVAYYFRYKNLSQEFSLDGLKNSDIHYHVIDTENEIVPKIKSLSNMFEKVLFISHDVLPFQTLARCLYDNVYYFGGQTTTKQLQSDILKQQGFSVPKYLVNVKSMQRIFDELGDRVIVRPDDYFSFGNKFVSFMTKKNGRIVFKDAEDSDNTMRFGKYFNMDNFKHKLSRFYFTNYIGSDGPVYWRGKIEALFGETTTSWLLQSYPNPPSAPFIRLKEATIHPMPKHVEDIAKKASLLMTDKTHCGYISVDLILNKHPDFATNENIFITEINMTTVGLCFSPPWQKSRKNEISNAILKKLKEI